jgi:hypothetical protein
LRVMHVAHAPAVHIEDNREVSQPADRRQGTFIADTLRRVGLAEQAALRESLLGWLRAADEAGLDSDGMAALFAASLRDFLDRRGEAGQRRGAGRRAARRQSRAGRATGEVA